LELIYLKGDAMWEENIFKKKDVKKMRFFNRQPDPSDCQHRKRVTVRSLNAQSVVRKLGYDVNPCTRGGYSDFRFSIRIPYGKDYKEGHEYHVEFFDDVTKLAAVCMDCKMVIDDTRILRDKIADQIADVRLKMDKTVEDWKEAVRIYKQYEKEEENG
jgi:hypothetical protein